MIADKGAYPLPATAPIEGGPNSDGDRHVLVVDRDHCKLYELYDAHPASGATSWHAGSGATFNLRSNKLRPTGWTSGDAAGLPILPGLARCHEVKHGKQARLVARALKRYGALLADNGSPWYLSGAPDEG